VNLLINLLLGDVSVVSISLVKGWWESNLGSVRDEGLLRSWPSESLDVLVGESLDILIDTILLFSSNGN